MEPGAARLDNTKLVKDMCGIFAVQYSNFNKSRLDRSLARLLHRGPDASDSLQTGNTYLGHTRLMVVDVDTASNQPYVSACNRFTLIFNGEIYNHRELKAQFKLRTKTASDTEILVELFALMGEQMLKYLNGMFAFVIHDAKTDKLFAARDRLGIKPLFFCQKGDSLAFSSEIPPLLDLDFVSDIKDDIGVRQFKKLRTCFGEKTLFKDISMLPAGHFWSNKKIVQYWKFPDTQQEAPSDDELMELIQSSIAYREVAEVSVGAFLSGGLDSSIITGIADVDQTWTVGFSDHNEFEWAKVVADHLEVDLNTVLCPYPRFLPTVNELVDLRGEPLSVPNEVLLYLMSKEVKLKNTVILSGEGADELMFGYDRIFRWANENEWDVRQFDQLYSYGSIKDDEIIESVMLPYQSFSSNINRIAAFFQISHLHGLLRRLDFTTMRCAVEARVPFVDHRLVERMAGVPFDYRMERGVVKAPLKRIFSDLLPIQTIKRAKVGFPVNLKKIFNDKQGKTFMDNWLQCNLERFEERTTR